MSRLTLEQKLRAGHVKRWNIVRVAREQTIAEHMYRVNLIAVDLCESVGLHNKVAKVSAWALMHDLPEVVTGDIVGPIKKDIARLSNGFDPVGSMELNLDEDYRELYLDLHEGDSICLSLVKLADLLEAMDFLRVEGKGPHAEEVLSKIREEYLASLQELSARYKNLNWAPAYVLYGTIGGSELIGGGPDGVSKEGRYEV